MAKGNVEFTGMPGRSCEISLDLENGFAYLKVDLNGERQESSTGKTYVCATGYKKFAYKGENHSLRCNFLQNKPFKKKDEIRDERDAMAARIAELEAAAAE